MHVKNCTSAYISPATSGVIFAILRRWEPEPPGRESFPFFSFRLARSPPLSLWILFFRRGSHRRHAPLRGEHSLMLHSARWVISGSAPGEKCYNCYVHRFEKLLVVAREEQIVKRNNFLLFTLCALLFVGSGSARNVEWDKTWEKFNTKFQRGKASLPSLTSGGSWRFRYKLILCFTW